MILRHAFTPLNNSRLSHLGGPMDVRFQFPKWRHAFAVVQPGRDGADQHADDGRDFAHCAASSAPK